MNRIRQFFFWRARFSLPFTMLTLALGAPHAAAQTAESDAGATLVSPLTVTGTDPLDFGEVTIASSPLAACIFEVPADGLPASSGGTSCRFLSGVQAPGRFTVGCQADTPVAFQLVYTDLAPSGASFSAPDAPLAVDAADSGPAYQVLPCDSDGESLVRAGGKLTVSSAATAGFSGRVGTIRLEVAYN